MISWLIVSFVLLIGVVFKFYQDNGKIGGSIAWSKVIWLCYTLIAWFFLPLALQFESYSEGFKQVLLMFTISFWIRGVLELFMLYQWKNWKPKYGIVHNLLTLVITLVGSCSLSINKTEESLFVLGVLVSLCLETYYAYFFHRYVGRKTEGDQAIWFANKDNPLFKKNLKITSMGNGIVYSILFYFLLHQ